MPSAPVALVAADGFQLVGHLYEPPAGTRARGVVVMAGATGVAQRYYRRFAETLAAHGVDVVTLDYRGVGASAPDRLRGFACDYLHWARQDLTAAVDFALARGPTVVVGHSFGGHAFGQLPDPNRTRGLYTVASGAAWSGYMPPSERLRVELLWNLVGPVSTALAGYLPGRIWGGESLPLGIYRNWKRWSHHPRYFFDEPGLGMQDLFDRVRVPVVGATASDDLWAPPGSVQVFMRHYRRAPLTLVTHTPAELGVPSLGHMGHFRASSLPAFVPQVMAFVDAQLGGDASRATAGTTA